MFDSRGKSDTKKKKRNFGREIGEKMGSLAPDLGLDLKLFVEKSVVGFLKDRVPAGCGLAAELEDLVSRLKDEQRKIEAFKHQLPLCRILLTDVIGVLKLELEQIRSGGCVLEEFMPLKSRSDEDERRGEVKLEKESKEKMEWMSSAQLWSDKCSDESVGCKKDSHEKRRDVESDGRRNNRALSLGSRSRSSSGGAFVPFKVIAAPRKEEEMLSNSLPDLSLVPPEIKVYGFAPTATAISDDDNNISGLCSKALVKATTPAASSATSCHQALQQPPRKMRRCWSPELHRRFVISLQQLGGAQVATPKQIRELMKADGLTNDEVKSHLQKYRLHTRRMPNSSGTPVVMVGGLWVSQDHCSTSQQIASQSGSPQGPLQLACAGQALSAAGGNSCDDDGKSESYGWK